MLYSVDGSGFSLLMRTSLFSLLMRIRWEGHSTTLILDRSKYQFLHNFVFTVTDIVGFRYREIIYR